MKSTRSIAAFTALGGLCLIMGGAFSSLLFGRDPMPLAKAGTVALGMSAVLWGFIFTYDITFGSLSGRGGRNGN